MGKIFYKILYIFFIFILGAYFSSLVYARDTVSETSETVTVRISRVYFKGNASSMPTYIPMLRSIYSCEGINVRKPVAEYTSPTLRTSYDLHGDRDYYRLRGNPMEGIVNLSLKNIGLNIEPIEFLGAMNSNGIQNTYGFWWGVDVRPDCNDTSVYSPLPGQLYGDVDRGVGSGGYERNIIGNSVYSGFAVKLLHLSTLDSSGLKFVPVGLNEKLSNVSTWYAHNHVTVMYGTGLGKIDVPYSYLLRPDQKVGTYSFYDTDGSTPSNVIIDKYLEVKKYDLNAKLNGFEIEKLEKTYKYLSTLTNKKVILDIGVKNQSLVVFDSNGKYTGVKEIVLPQNIVPNNPPTTQIDPEIKRYQFFGKFYMYNAVQSGNTYVKNGFNGKFCTNATNNVGVYGKRINVGLLIFADDKKTVLGICSWYENYMKELQ